MHHAAFRCVLQGVRGQVTGDLGDGVAVTGRGARRGVEPQGHAADLEGRRHAAAALVGGLPLARSGVAALLATRRPDIKLLMTIAVVGAAAIGACPEAALVVVLFASGAASEERAAARARRELAGLVSLTPPTARVRRRARIPVDGGPVSSRRHDPRAHRSLVAEAQAQKSPSERWVDAFSRWYTPAVVGAAVLVATVPPLVGLAGFSSSFYAALALLILACPCALVISIPVAIVSALGRASASGVLVKGGAHLEQAAAIRAVAFDKTGTLTAARPEVVAVRALRGSHQELLALAAAVEAGSEHPLARAVVQAAGKGPVSSEAEGFEALAGCPRADRPSHGTVGDLRLIPSPDATLRATVGTLRRSGATAVIAEDEPLGGIGIADAIRAGAAQAVSDPRRLGVGPLVMLTGDNAVTAAAVAEATGVDEVRAGLLPRDEAEAVAAMGRDVAMLGDGVNEAPALATSSLGVATGSAGSDTAIEVADVAIMGDDPGSSPG